MLEELQNKKEELNEVKKRKKNLKLLKEKKEISSEEYFLELMNIEDDELLTIIDMHDIELREACKFKNNRAEDLCNSIGNLQRYNTELAKLKLNRYKAKRYLDKVYGEKYEYYRMGKGHIKLNNQKEYDIWIAKDSKYARTNSYCETYDIAIKQLEEGIKQLHNKTFAIQTLIKSTDYNVAPEY